ncbi:ABC transporter substrate-binding protein [Chloroflexota bacterium]
MSSKISDFWYTFCPVVCASHIAQNKGWLEEEFAEDGIKLSHISTLPVKDWQSHFSHKHPQLFRDGGNIPPIWTRSEGAATKVIGMVWANGGQAIMVRKDSLIKSVKDLKGKRVALPRRLSNLIDFRRAVAKRGIIMSLKAHGLTQDDIQFVDLPIDIPDIATEKQPPKRTGWAISPETREKIPQQLEVEALQNGEVDAISSYHGREVVLEQLGVSRIIYNVDKHSDWKYRVNIGYPYICTVNADFATQHPDLITRWMKVLVRAGIWAKENYAEVVRIMAKETNVTEEAVQKSYPSDFHKHLVPEISEEGIEALEIEKQFLREHGFINNDFDIRSWLDRSFLDAALKELET